MIKLFHHVAHPDAIENVTAVLKSGWTGLGEVTAQFEKEVATYLNTPYVVALNSGTAALQIALATIQASAGSYIITTPLTFISGIHSIVRAGFIPIFADVESETGNIDPKSIEKLLNSPFIAGRVKAIIVVHYGGLPVDMDAVYDISNKYNIDIIEDAAHAFGSEYQGEKIGCLHSKLVAFSLHSVKPLAIGDGGLLATHDPNIDKLARQLRWCGIDKSTADRTKSSGYLWDYDVKCAGFKNHMNDIQAAIGLGQLKHYEEDRKYRQALVNKYRELLANVEQIELLNTFPNRVSANHLFVIKGQTKEIKEKLMQHLYESEIGFGCHYRPSSMYKIYQRAETDNGCPRAIDFFERCISLPLHLNLSMNDIEYICQKIKENL